MGRYVLLFCAVLTISTVATASVLDNTMFPVGTWDLDGGVSRLPTNPVFGESRIDHLELSILLPKASVLRPMEVTVTPEWPEPFEEVVATVSGKTTDPYLRLDDTAVSYRGNDVVIELEWSTYTPLPSGTIAAQSSCNSVGYAVEQVQLSPTATLDDYEIPVPIGGFDVGKHRIYVNSEGALEGEAQASFEVRDEYPMFPRPVDDGSWTSLLEKYNPLGWQYERPIWFHINDPVVIITPTE